MLLLIWKDVFIDLYFSHFVKLPTQTSVEVCVGNLEDSDFPRLEVNTSCRNIQQELQWSPQECFGFTWRNGLVKVETQTKQNPNSAISFQSKPALDFRKAKRTSSYFSLRRIHALHRVGLSRTIPVKHAAAGRRVVRTPGGRSLLRSPLCLQVQHRAGLAAAVAVLRPVPAQPGPPETRPEVCGVPAQRAAGLRLSAAAAELAQVCPAPPTQKLLALYVISRLHQSSWLLSLDNLPRGGKSLTVMSCFSLFLKCFLYCCLSLRKKKTKTHAMWCRTCCTCEVAVNTNGLHQRCTRVTNQMQHLHGLRYKYTIFTVGVCMTTPGRNGRIISIQLLISEQKLQQWQQHHVFDLKKKIIH